MTSMKNIQSVVQWLRSDEYKDKYLNIVISKPHEEWPVTVTQKMTSFPDIKEFRWEVESSTIILLLVFLLFYDLAF